MASRLNELLERIRPVGAPGPSIGGDRIEPAADAELAEVVAAIADLEEAAAATITAGREAASRRAAIATARIQELRAGLPQQEAERRSLAEQAEDRVAETEAARAEEDAARREVELRARAERELPGLVDAVVAEILSILDVGAAPDRIAATEPDGEHW